MTRTLYTNRISWAKAFALFQFNARIQSIQNVESFNSIIKKSLNNISTLCDIEETIDKRYKEEVKYCKLTDIKSLHMTIGLSHLFFSIFFKC
jgi:hypothetical protein